MAEHEIEFLLRNISDIPRDWRGENEQTAVRNRRRMTLARKLSKLAQEVADNPELSGLCFDAGLISCNIPPEERKGLLTLAAAMHEGVAELERNGRMAPIPSAYANNLPMTRKIRLKSYALLAIFDLLAPYFTRAPNRESEILSASSCHFNGVEKNYGKRPLCLSIRSNENETSFREHLECSTAADGI